jgi:hypothetical protein
MLKLLFVSFSLLILLAGAITESAIARGVAARYLLFKPSAASMAMGGVGVSSSDNAFSTYYNPAALAFAPEVSIVGSFDKPIPFFDATIHSLAGLSYRFPSGDYYYTLEGRGITIVRQMRIDK